MREVYRSLNAGEKIAFIIRHSERDDYGNLTQDGITWAREVGGGMLAGGLAGSDDIALYSSNKQRCIDTANLIAEGSGRTNLAQPEILSTISSCPYGETPSGSGWEDYSLFAYDEPVIHEGYLHDKTEHTEEVFNLVTSHMSKILNFFVTHDQLLEIFVPTMTEKQISLRFWDGAVNDGIQEKRWITYMAGLAIIKKIDGSYEWCPVRTLSRGYQRDYHEKVYP